MEVVLRAMSFQAFSVPRHGADSIVRRNKLGSAGFCSKVSIFAAANGDLFRHYTFSTRP